MSESLTIGDYQLQLARTTTAASASNYGKTNLWREIKNIRAADPNNVVISAELRSVKWQNTTAMDMANEIHNYWSSMNNYIEAHNAQDEENHNHNPMVILQQVPASENADNEPEVAAETEESTTHVRSSQIPTDVEECWIGFDVTKNYIIDSNGVILYDLRVANDQSHDAARRDRFYHSHKRYLISQFRNMCEKSRPLSILYTINRERLGLPGSVATCMFSPLFYQPRYSDLRVFLSSAINYVVQAIEERGRLPIDIQVDSAELLIFMKNFRETLQRDAPDLLSNYDESICGVLKKESIDEVLELFSNSIPPSMASINNDAAAMDVDNGGEELKENEQ